MYFPQITLTGFLGGQSIALAKLFEAPERQQEIAPAAVLPLFNAGQIRAGVRFSEAQKREMVITYQKTIYTGLREVSDALVGYSGTREQRTQEELLVKALGEHAPVEPALQGRTRQLSASARFGAQSVPGSARSRAATAGGDAIVRAAVPGAGRRLAVEDYECARPCSYARLLNGRCRSGNFAGT